MGLQAISKLVICCAVVGRLSIVNVASNSSKNRTLSDGLPILRSDMPSLLTDKARMP